MACAASTAPPVAMEPDSAIGPSNHWRISCISANGLFTPAWPPAPAATAIRPSAPFSIALLRELVVDDVVQRHAAVAVHRVVHVGARAQRGDDDRHLVLHDHLHVVLEPVVALVHDLVDGERRGGLVGVGLVVGRERLR
jgi:hypothetical protein